MARIIVGMSGGVDSSVAAYLLKAAGHEVIGVTLKNWETEEGSDSRFQDIKDAKKIAEVLGIQHVVLECAPDFRERVIQPFIKDYLNGLTPSPCTGCNRCLKWAKMLDTAKAMQAEKLVFVTDIEGVFIDPSNKKTLISEMDINTAKDFIGNGVVGGGMLPKLNNCIEAIEQGVSRVHILDGRLAHCLLLEFFTEKGIGTAILKEPLF